MARDLMLAHWVRLPFVLGRSTWCVAFRIDVGDGSLGAVAEITEITDLRDLKGDRKLSQNNGNLDVPGELGVIKSNDTGMRPSMNRDRVLEAIS